jgi:hypothetical protein
MFSKRIKNISNYRNFKFNNNNNNFNFKRFNLKRKYNTNTNSTKSNYLIGYLGIAGLIGGGLLLLNTLNMPTVSDKVLQKKERGLLTERSSIPKYIQGKNFFFIF